MGTESSIKFIELIDQLIIIIIINYYILKKILKCNNVMNKRCTSVKPTVMYMIIFINGQIHHCCKLDTLATR
jgi:hypothetical protein